MHYGMPKSYRKKHKQQQFQNNQKINLYSTKQKEQEELSN